MMRKHGSYWQRLHPPCLVGWLRPLPTSSRVCGPFWSSLRWAGSP